MHDVESQLSIIDAGSIHAELHLIRAGHLRGQHGSFAQYDHASFSDRHQDALSPTRGRSGVWVDARQRIDCGICKLHEGETVGWTLQRLTGKSDDFVDAL